MQLIGLVRSTAFKLCRDESILINAVAPGPVDTPISEITKKFVPIENFTPMKLLIESLDKIIDEDFTGRVIECSNKKIHLFEFSGFSDENSRFLIEDMIRL
jgi:NAD(P)-dependent dehydrogenase (short-subunit alcohol dehydrogenase family)